MKFKTTSGKFDVSSTQVPGRGSGIFDFKTGSQAEFEVACSLNLPANFRMQMFIYAIFFKVDSIVGRTYNANELPLNALWTSLMSKLQTAEPTNPFVLVVNVA